MIQPQEISNNINILLKDLLSIIPEELDDSQNLKELVQEYIKNPMILNSFKFFIENLYMLMIPFEYKVIAIKENLDIIDVITNYFSFNLSYFKLTSKNIKYTTNYLNDQINKINIDIDCDKVINIYILLIKFIFTNIIKQYLVKFIFSKKISNFIYLKYVNNIEKYYPELKNIEHIATAFIKYMLYYTIVGYQQIFYDLILYTLSSIIIRTKMYIAKSININFNKNKLYKVLKYILNFLLIKKIEEKILGTEMLQYFKYKIKLRAENVV